MVVFIIMGFRDGGRKPVKYLILNSHSHLLILDLPFLMKPENW
jgi:hypothetical protein